jgi:hypothetical protein
MMLPCHEIQVTSSKELGMRRNGEKMLDSLVRIAKELRSAEKQVKMQRRARLLELYKMEALQ